VQTLSNLFSVARSIDFYSIKDVFTNPGQKSMGDWVPLIVGSVAIWIGFKSFLRTFSFAISMVTRLFRYGSLIALALSMFGWVTGQFNGNNRGAGAGAGNPLQGLASGLGSYASGNGAQGLFDVASGFAGQMADAWQQGQKKQPVNARSTKSKSSTRSGRKGAAQGEESLSDMAQNWVKNAALKAAGLEGVFGEGDAKQKTKGNEKTRGR
jgi:hypothetical protein